jgi:hypothetical protein
MKSVICGLPSPSLVKSLSLKVDDRRKLDPEADFCESSYQKLLQHICTQLSCAKKWSRLTSSHIIVDVIDDTFTNPICKRGRINIRAKGPVIISLLQVNISKVENFSSLAIPQMG